MASIGGSWPVEGWCLYPHVRSLSITAGGDGAMRDLQAIRTELHELNESAGAGLDEGFEETLTLHRPGLFPLLGRSLKTTSVLESVIAQADRRCGRVDHWKNSNQKQRWIAAALLNIERRLRKLFGHRHLPTLRAVIQREHCITAPDPDVRSTAA